jgi:hypothetical protein
MSVEDNYIKMVLALPDEFFKDWKYEDGDQVFLLEDIDDYSSSFDPWIGTYTVFDGCIATDGLHNIEEWTYVEYVVRERKLKPIPSQRQLQDMLMAHKPHKVESFVGDLHALFFNFRTWIQNGDEDSWWDFRDELENFDQAWLCYAMEVLYNKNWNGEKWI